MIRSPVLAAALAAFLPLAATGQQFGAEMPTNPAPGVTFPTSETEINSWVFANPQQTDRIARHAWGIWAGLTTETGQTHRTIPNALVYQSWLSPSGILALMNGDDSNPVIGLRTPGQFARHAVKVQELMDPNPKSATGLVIDYSIAEVVAYSPPAAQHAFNNKLLWTETLQRYLDEGYTEMPPFPYDAVTIKPVYKLITADELNGGRYYAMPAWPGVPDISGWTPAEMKRGFPNSVPGPNGTMTNLWGLCVYIDMQAEGPSGSSGTDAACEKPVPAATYSLDDFISIRITDENQVRYFKGLTPEGNPVHQKLATGDTLILVGMHVTSREAMRWTWQTFWWTPDPANPQTPSSAAIAAERPSTLSHAAAHYAMSHAYSMLVPAQPLVGGQNAGNLVPAFNPHLEAGFGTEVFGATAAVETPDGSVTTNLGIQSNCMSCHGMAVFPSSQGTYVSNFYVPRNAPNFTGGMTLDFAWSIVDEAEPKPKPKQ